MTYSRPRVPFFLTQCDQCGAQVLTSSTALHDKWHNGRCDAISNLGDRCKRTDPHDDTAHQAKGYTWQGTYS